MHGNSNHYKECAGLRKLKANFLFECGTFDGKLSVVNHNIETNGFYGGLVIFNKPAVLT